MNLDIDNLRINNLLKNTKGEVFIKKKIFRLTAVLLTLMLMFSLIGCSAPPAGNKTITDANRYMDVNSYVKKTLETNFCNSLPESIDDNNSENSYYYYYQCSLLGDPGFIIDLKSSFDNYESLQLEEQRINSIPSGFNCTINNKKYYIINGDIDEFKQYSDDIVYDGKSYIFEIVMFDFDKNSIEYLSALQYDGTITDKNNTVENFIKPIIESDK